MRAAFIIAAVAACSVASVPARADSLYSPAKSRSMFSDRKAHGVGDVVTVQITETTVAAQDASLQTDRSLQASAAGGTGGPFGLLKLVPKASLGGSTSAKGSGSTSRTSNLTTTITCRVTSVTPSGQLMVTGTRMLKVNNDTQTVHFTGIVRPEDLSADNTIASSLVGDAQIEVRGKGPIDRHTRPGILSEIFRFLF